MSLSCHIYVWNIWCVHVARLKFLLICEAKQESCETDIKQCDKVLANWSTSLQEKKQKKQCHRALHSPVLLKWTLPSAAPLSLLQQRCTITSVCVGKYFYPGCQPVWSKNLCPLTFSNMDQLVSGLFWGSISDTSCKPSVWVVFDWNENNLKHLFWLIHWPPCVLNKSTLTIYCK